MKKSILAGSASLALLVSAHAFALAPGQDPQAAALIQKLQRYLPNTDGTSMPGLAIYFGRTQQGQPCRVVVNSRDTLDRYMVRLTADQCLPRFPQRAGGSFNVMSYRDRYEYTAVRNVVEAPNGQQISVKSTWFGTGAGDTGPRSQQTDDLTIAHLQGGVAVVTVDGVSCGGLTTRNPAPAPAPNQGPVFGEPRPVCN